MKEGYKTADIETEIEVKTGHRPRRKRQPWLRALQKFVPLSMMANAVTTRHEWVVIVSILLSFALLWVEEEKSDSENTPNKPS